MAIKSGFFDSLDGDRKYNAEDFGDVMSMAVTDGVDNNYLDELIVTAGSGLTVNVGGGRCFFNKHFLINDSAYNLSLQAASNNLSRIDAIIVDVKGSNSFRTVTLDVVTGTQSSSPVRPTLIKNDSQERWQYALAYVTIPAGAVNVQASNIADVRGTSDTPWIYKTGEYDSALNNYSTNAPQTRVVAEQIDYKNVTMKTYVDNEFVEAYKVMGYNGAKNLNSMPYSVSTNPYTENGITWTRNADGSVTANGTATANTFYYCHYRAGTYNNLTIKNGTYILSGSPSGGGDGKYWLACSCTKNSSESVLGIDRGSGATMTINGDDNDANSAKLSVILTVRSGYTANNLTFYPMLRYNEDTDTTYQPYAMTNKKLTEVAQSVEVKVDQVTTLYLYDNSSVTLEVAIANWADTYKGSSHKYNILGNIICNSGYYTLHCNVLNNAGGITGGICIASVSPYKVYQVSRSSGSNAVLTELAPKDWAEPRLKFTGKSVTVAANTGVGVTIPLPTGYTPSNSRVVSADIVDSNGTVYSLYYGSSTYYCSSDLYMDSTGIHTTVNNSTSSSATLMLRVYLQQTFGIYG